MANIKRSRLYNWFDHHQITMGLVLLGICVVWLYVWVITIGRFDQWPGGKNYYGLLSDAFQNGETHLLIEPSAELLNLENPYDFRQRKGIPYLWDSSLYKGKYYLYWGPVPGVIGALFSLFASKTVTDTGLVFTFVIGTALFSILLLRGTYRKFKYPGWLFWSGVVASAVNVPLIWLLTRPTVYEASIAGGQFFLMAGLYFAFCSFCDPNPHKGYLILSTTALGLAGGTRINLLFSIIFLTVMIVWYVYVFYQKKINEILPILVPVLFPLFVIFSSLLLYNYARFGSFFEFGHRYQLTGANLPSNYEDITSINYIIPNAFTYMFRLPGLNAAFPYLTVPWVTQKMWPFFIHIPEHYYYTEPTAGILFIIPLVGLTALFLLRLLWLFINGELRPAQMDEPVHSKLFSWLVLSILGYISIQAFILLTFISSAIRYLFDISPVLIVLCILLIGHNLHRIAQKPYQVRLIVLLWILTTGLTVLSGILIGLTGERNNFLNINPQLYYQYLEWLH